MKNKPFLLKPAPKDYMWGGNRLNDDYNYGIDIEPFAEAWICSMHPDGQSRLVSGKLLGDVIRNNPEYLGNHVLQITEGRVELPILIKLIDAKNNISIQVHPDDEYAKRLENSWGKTEIWYVLSAEKGSEVIYGFNQDVTPEQVIEHIESGKVLSLLNHVPAHKGDLFHIDSGTVHAIGAGCLVAEIQQNSNITYRLYDYDRVDKTGKKRHLNIEKALEVANLKMSVMPRQPMRVLKYRNGCAYELLTRCKYFQVERMLLNTEGRGKAEFKTGKNSFHVLLCINGYGVAHGDDVEIPFNKGECIFVPADSMLLRLHGSAELLNVSC